LNVGIKTINTYNTPSDFTYLTSLILGFVAYQEEPWAGIENQGRTNR
jgi:hypothetical protein